MFERVRNLDCELIVLGSKVSTAKNIVVDNVSYGAFLASEKVNKSSKKLKSKITECKDDLKAKREEKKTEREEKKAEKEAKREEKKKEKDTKKEDVKETVSKVSTESKSEESTFENDEDPTKTINVTINNTFVDGEVVESSTLKMPEPVKEEEMIPAPDFSSLQRGVIIETIEPEDIREATSEKEEKITTPLEDKPKPVTEDDVKELTKKMRGGSVKIK